MFLLYCIIDRLYWLAVIIVGGSFLRFGDRNIMTFQDSFNDLPLSWLMLVGLVHVISSGILPWYIAQHLIPLNATSALMATALQTDSYVHRKQVEEIP